MTQPLVLSRLLTLVVTALQVSLALTWDATVASVGGLAGLQPRSLPTGTVRSGGAVSALQGDATGLRVALGRPPVAVTVNVRVMTHPLVLSRRLTLVLTALQVSLALTCDP